MANTLTLYSQDPLFKPVLEYLYDTYPDDICDFTYSNECKYSRYEFRRYRDNPKIKSVYPNECEFTFRHYVTDDPENTLEHEFHCKLEISMNKAYANAKVANANPQLFCKNLGCEGAEDRILKRLQIKGDNKEDLIEFVDKAKEVITKKHEISKKSVKDTIRIFYFRKEFWNLLAKSPKRSIDTLYLKEGEKEKLVSLVDTFFDDKTRDIYLSYGMPYKQIVMLYGIPGSGKTSTITALASHFDCDIYSIPITKELTDYGLIDAFSYINEKEDKKRIIVLEDIDCIFDTSRKEGDENNMVTLQALLNCLDGHTCVEGTLLFMTANNPEKMDYAMIRSCRIDYKLELGYANEYQVKCIYDTFLPKQSENFKKFYRKIEHNEVTTAMLQEFLFYNRDCDNILEHMDQLMDIIDKNKPSKLSSKKEKNLYM